MKSFYFFGVAVVLTLVHCTSDKKVNSEAVREEIRNREIIKVSEAEIANKVLELGNTLASAAKSTLGQNLHKAMQSGGSEHAVAFCNLEAGPLTDSLSKAYGAEIKRVSLKARNPGNIPDQTEAGLLEAYAYQWKDSISLQPNVQSLSENRYLFTKPILIDNALCLNCHGEIGKGMTEETNAFIKTKYPVDKAIGYRFGDLRGMWSIVFAKKNIIQSMQD